MNRKPFVLFGMAHAGFFRNFETTIIGLLEANVDVHVHFSKDHTTIKMSDYSLSHLKTTGVLTFSVNYQTNYKNSITVERIRLLRDILHYSQPAFKHAVDLQERFTTLQKPHTLTEKKQIFLKKLFNRIPGSFKNKLDSFLCKTEKFIAPMEDASALIKKFKPDYVIVTPLVNFASKEVDLVKAAKTHRIPTLLTTASWDNLTNKGRIMIQPDHIAVWNNAMAQEAMHLHNVSQKKIWITGAPPFDHWFERKPSRTRKEFCKLLKFDPEQPIIVYLCSSQGIAGEAEYNIVKQWRLQLSNSHYLKLSKANILIRPHPMALQSWHDLFPKNKSEIGKLWKAKIWPLNPKHPTTEQGRADFFDTLYHADAIVGLNTSAMIEAAILNKPVFTFLGHNVTQSQTGNLHFEHLSKSRFLNKANNLSEHIEQLNAALESNQSYTETCQQFIADFVRPLGRNISASNELVNKILERLSKVGYRLG